MPRIDEQQRQEAIVNALLHERQRLTQQELSHRTGIGRTQIATSIAGLEELDVVIGRQRERGGGGGGPRPMEYGVNGKAGYVVGIDFGRRHLRVLVVDFTGQRVDEVYQTAQRRREDQKDLPPDGKEVLEDATALVQNLLVKHHISYDKVLGVGVAIAGPWNQENREASITILRDGEVLMARLSGRKRCLAKASTSLS